MPRVKKVGLSFLAANAEGEKKQTILFGGKCRCGVVCLWGFRWSYSATENSSLPTPQRGHSKSSGSSSKGVPGAMPASGKPSAGLYSQPQTSQTYVFMIFVRFNGLIIGYVLKGGYRGRMFPSACFRCPVVVRRKRAFMV